MSEAKKHLFIGDGNKQAINYLASSSRSSQTIFIPRNPSVHGSILDEQLTKSIIKDESLKKGIFSSHENLTKHDGLYLSIKSETGTQLDTGKFNNTTLKLCTVKEENGQETLTFYVEKEDVSYLKTRINEYSLQKTSTGKPKNQSMLNNIQKIELARFEDFWSDDLALLPKNRNEPVYFEMWLQNDAGVMDGDAKKLRTNCDILGINLSKSFIKLHNTYIFKAKASISQLELLITSLPNIIEFRLPVDTPKVYVTMSMKDQIEFNEDLQDRIELGEKAEDILVSVLDTGINYNNFLLRKVSHQSLSSKYAMNWPDYSEYPYHNIHDDYHGSLQAGICAFGSSLQSLLASKEKILCTHKVESGRILPPAPGSNPEELFGAITIDTANKLIVDRPHAKRVFSMAVTSSEKQNGYPTSWSAAIDDFCINVDSGFNGNLFLVSAGNSLTKQPNYWQNARTSNVQDPAQAWNVVTVGSYTKLCNITGANNAQILSRLNDINATTTSSLNWDWDKAPIKPDILCEGGNYHILSDGTIDKHDDLGILTASGKTLGNVFDINSDTSAATAEASFIAARIMATYPNYKPQTIRALMIHWASWTKPMQDELQSLKDQGVSDQLSKKQILRVCGYGVPNLEKAIDSKKNRLTLIIESTIRPFDNKFKLNEFNLHNLPWPEDTLRSLPGDIPVTLTVTLSYFIEPNPRVDKIQNKYVYRSHGLIFDLIKPTQKLEHFIASQNRPESRNEDYEETAQDKNWYFKSNLRRLGSIHKDIWQGTTSELSEMSKIIVKPSTGWWKLNKDSERCAKEVDYSLILSIEISDNEIDIYSEVLNKIKATNNVLSPIHVTIPSSY